ncbi:hypothetical protein CMUS01_12742 [Colletotrichum musicola]|uniref:Uncharacterized protein n=1 Tax=Colletotrichum musicola TaxID=2175873 RepID=A0A8H6MYP1_9PEZI|nr:hypothetical protein CMUS01_12742 [Colletotrichum musicola]
MPLCREGGMAPRPAPVNDGLLVGIPGRVIITAAVNERRSALKTTLDRCRYDRRGRYLKRGAAQARLPGTPAQARSLFGGSYGATETTDRGARPRRTGVHRLVAQLWGLFTGVRTDSDTQARLMPGLRLQTVPDLSRYGLGLPIMRQTRANTTGKRQTTWISRADDDHQPPQQPPPEPTRTVGDRLHGAPPYQYAARPLRRPYRPPHHHTTARTVFRSVRNRSSIVGAKQPAHYSILSPKWHTPRVYATRTRRLPALEQSPSCARKHCRHLTDLPRFRSPSAIQPYILANASSARSTPSRHPLAMCRDRNQNQPVGNQDACRREALESDSESALGWGRQGGWAKTRLHSQALRGAKEKEDEDDEEEQEQELNGARGRNKLEARHRSFR